MFSSSMVKNNLRIGQLKEEKKLASFEDMLVQNYYLLQLGNLYFPPTNPSNVLATSTALLVKGQVRQLCKIAVHSSKG